MFIPFTLVDYLTYAAEHYPEKIAVRHQDSILTYQSLDRLTTQLASALIKKGLKRNDRAVICLGNTLETVLLFWAILKSNSIVSIVNPELPSQKINFILEDSGATFLFITPGKLAALSEQALVGVPVIVEVSGGQFHDLFFESMGEPIDLPTLTLDIDLAVIIYTSGSTGAPKGVMLTHRNMLSASASIHRYLKLVTTDTIISALPLSFDYGLYQVILSCLAGATLILESDFTWPLQFIKQISTLNATIFPAVPTMISILSNLTTKLRHGLSSVRSVTNTGAVLLEKHIKTINHLFPNAEVYSMYGLTECKRCTYLPPALLKTKAKSVGIPIPNTEAWIVNGLNQRVPPFQVGQLVVRGSTVMAGYWKRPEETNKVLKRGIVNGERVLYTKDYGYMDEEGFFYFCGRHDDVIKRYGQKVSLKEIEEVIYLFPSVYEVAVIDLPSKLSDSKLIAFVVSDRKDNLLAAEVMQYCRESLHKSHWPSEIRVLTSLPKSVNGKLDKLALKKSSLNSVGAP